MAAEVGESLVYAAAAHLAVTDERSLEANNRRSTPGLVVAVALVLVVLVAFLAAHSWMAVSCTRHQSTARCRDVTVMGADHAGCLEAPDHLCPCAAVGRKWVLGSRVFAVSAVGDVVRDHLQDYLRDYQDF